MTSERPKYPVQSACGGYHDTFYRSSDCFYPINWLGGEKGYDLEQIFAHIRKWAAQTGHLSADGKLCWCHDPVCEPRYRATGFWWVCCGIPLPPIGTIIRVTEDFHPEHVHGFKKGMIFVVHGYHLSCNGDHTLRVIFGPDQEISLPVGGRNCVPYEALGSVIDFTNDIMRFRDNLKALLAL